MKRKIQKVQSKEKIDRMKDGVRERASTWSKTKKFENRSIVKKELRKDFM